MKISTIKTYMPNETILHTMQEVIGKEAILYTKVGDRVKCTACARYCTIPEGKIGLCGIRGNVNGKLQLFVYGKVIAGHIDPIEKKPVIHYRPGSKIFSIATTGCNWLCQPKGTKVLMADGTTKKIENIKSGDMVWSYDIDNGFKIVPNTVTHTGSRFAELLEVRYGSRSHGKLLLTKEHPVLTEKGWKLAEKLKLGDKILKVWYQNTSSWKERRAKTMKSAEFTCSNCGEVILGLEEWNRHRGDCYLQGYEMPEELRNKYRKRMLTNNPMYEPAIVRKMVNTQRTKFLNDPTYGWHKNVERLRQWLHKHPSESQKLLYKLLDDLHLKYEKEYRIEVKEKIDGSKAHYIADAAIVDAKLDIEVDGWWHYKSAQVMKSDKIRDRTLELNGWSVLRISGRDVYSHPEEVKTLILERMVPTIRKNKKEWLEVTEVCREKVEEVISFECIPNHNYVGDGILLHNCQYCQNYDISQRRKIEGVDMTPADVVNQTKSYGCEGIAYTYNQPSIFIEFARDCGVLARKNGIFNIFVSNGYDTPETVGMMKEFLDCITVDFKGSAEPKFTRRYIGVPDPQPIFDTLREIRDKTNIHVEITDLIVPQVGDDLDAARKLARFVYDELGPDMPMHFLRFHPDYKMMNFPDTPVETLEKHYLVAKEVGLKYVYLGNVPGHKWEHTYCPECNNIVVGRFGFNITKWNLDEDNCCNACGYPIPIIGKLSTSVFDNRFQFVV